MCFPYRVVSGIVVTQPAFCFCQGVVYLLPVSSGLGGIHPPKQSRTFVVLHAHSLVVLCHVVIVSLVGEASARRGVVVADYEL